MNKTGYLVRCLRNLFQKKECPYCRSQELMLLQRKYIITTLLKCKNCGLNHRHPKDDPKFLQRFYQKDYHVKVEMMADLPADEKLAELKSNKFSDLRDFSDIVNALFKNQPVRIVDYGCSWGYNVFKLISKGFDATGYELSIPRAQFGEKKLNVTIAIKENDIPEKNDVFFSSHVIEHLYSLPNFFLLAKAKLAQEGIFMAICPNGGPEFRKRMPSTYSLTWGSLHPNYIDIDFASFVFKNNPYLLLTSDWTYDLQKIRSWDGRSQVTDDYREGYELLIIAKPNIEI